MHLVKVKSGLLIITSILMGLNACSTMQLKEYPESSIDIFQKAKSIEDVSATAQPILEQDISEDYFGVDLLEQGILAVYLSVKNDNLNTSFIVPAESIYLADVKSENSTAYDPGKEDMAIAKPFATVGSLLVSFPLLWVAAQQSSDAYTIRENFGVKEFRTKTIDPGQRASGFSYFDWKSFKEIDEANICFKLIDPVDNRSFPYCININLRK